MSDRMYYFILGFSMAMLMASVIILQFPIPETDQACGECGMKAWYFKIAEGE